jgi:hypothetical protein
MAGIADVRIGLEVPTGLDSDLAATAAPVPEPRRRWIRSAMLVTQRWPDSQHGGQWRPIRRVRFVTAGFRRELLSRDLNGMASSSPYVSDRAAVDSTDLWVQ